MSGGLESAKNIRKSLAILTIAGAVSVGYTGVAGAQTTTDPTPTTPPVTQPHKVSCDTAQDRLARLQHRDEQIKDRLAKAEARVDKLRKEGHDEQADKLAKRIEGAKDRLAKVEARVDKVQARIHERCDSHAAGQ